MEAERRSYHRASETNGHSHRTDVELVDTNDMQPDQVHRFFDIPDVVL